MPVPHPDPVLLLRPGDNGSHHANKPAVTTPHSLFLCLFPVPTPPSYSIRGSSIHGASVPPMSTQISLIQTRRVPQDFNVKGFKGCTSQKTWELNLL